MTLCIGFDSTGGQQQPIVVQGIFIGRFWHCMKQVTSDFEQTVLDTDSQDRPI